MGKIAKAILIPIFFLMMLMSIYFVMLTFSSNLSLIFVFIVPFLTYCIGNLEVDLVKDSKYKINIASLMFALGGLFCVFSSIIAFEMAMDPNLGIIVPGIGVVYGSNKLEFAYAIACSNFFFYHRVGRSCHIE